MEQINLLLTSISYLEQMRVQSLLPVSSYYPNWHFEVAIYQLTKTQVIKKGGYNNGHYGKSRCSVPSSQPDSVQVLYCRYFWSCICHRQQTLVILYLLDYLIIIVLTVISMCFKPSCVLKLIVFEYNNVIQILRFDFSTTNLTKILLITNKFTVSVEPKHSSPEKE